MSDGFFDLQVNGYGGVDFNSDDLNADTLHIACQRMEADGVSGILATIITEELSVMVLRLEKLAHLRERDALVQRIIAGLHIEGPFISPVDGYRGAHPLDAVLPANIEMAKRLVEAGGGLTRLVTLAPEYDENQATTRFLVGEGVKVAAGHTNASRSELEAAINAGLSLFTHLGNGCPMNMNRHDNIVQRALSLSDKLWLCFIADGAHVPFFALRNYLKLAPHAVIVTDAIAPAGLGKGRFTLGRWNLEIGDDMVARSPDGSHLVGAVVTMQQSATNLKERVGLDDATVRRLLVEAPRAAIGLGSFAP